MSSPCLLGESASGGGPAVHRRVSEVVRVRGPFDVGAGVGLATEGAGDVDGVSGGDHVRRHCRRSAARYVRVVRVGMGEHVGLDGMRAPVVTDVDIDVSAHHVTTVTDSCTSPAIGHTAGPAKTRSGPRRTDERG